MVAITEAAATMDGTAPTASTLATTPTIERHSATTRKTGMKTATARATEAVIRKTNQKGVSRSVRGAFSL